MDPTLLLSRWRNRLASREPMEFLLDCPRFISAICNSSELADRVRGLLERADALGSEYRSAEVEQNDADASLLEYVWARLEQLAEPGLWLTKTAKRFEEVYRDPALPVTIAFDPQVQTDGGRLGTLLKLLDEGVASVQRGNEVVAEFQTGLEELRSRQETRHASLLLATQRDAGVALLRLQFVGRILDAPGVPSAVHSRPPGGVGRAALAVRELGHWGWPELIRDGAASPASPAPPRVPGLVERLRPLVDLLCFELEDEGYAVAVPFHVRISTDEARRRLDHTDEAFAFHLSEDQLRSRFVDPWTKRQEIVCDGLTFDPGHTRIEVLEDPNFSSQPFRGAPDWARSVGEPGVRNVTDRFLTHRVADRLPAESDADEDAPIFVVHGRDDLRKTETARLIERCTDREAKILHEQANRGQTLIEKFERHATGISFAVILLTADDIGGLSPDELNPRARQNVVFEHGFFTGVLGRDRVAVLCDADVERPSDIDGLVYIVFDEGGRWKYELLTEIEAAGIVVDRKRVV